MSQTISVPDDVYRRVAAIAERQGQQVDDVVAALLAMITDASDSSTGSQVFGNLLQTEGDPLVAVMRARAHLMEPKEFASHPVSAELPPYGSMERADLLEEIGMEASDALEHLGMSVSDLVER